MSTNKRMIEAVWESYRTEIVPADASRVQLQETRRAFYAGAMGLFEVVNRMHDPCSGPTTADIENMSSLMEELREWAIGVEQGRG